MSRLEKKYKEEILPQLMKEFGYKNKLQAPKMDKIVVNMGVGRALENHRRLEAATHDLALITGQKPVITKAKRSVSGFKLREGNPIGCKVTLRGKYMYHFMDKLISIAIPRIRDFRGLSTRSFDGRGNYTFGVSEQIIFPEINIDKVEFIQGMDITLVTTASSDKEAFQLLSLFGMPFRKDGK
ncbi:MAG: 50S ribosomal protein L5 [Planctomycetota bacterium]|nr:MAG: 50S ribosomal protein L5 [Planctomycetota bacterium]